MDQHNYPKSFLNLLKNVKGKRSQIVVQHILEHGYITSEELQRQYGYEHPPRAVRDVREQGIPIETFRITTPEGKSIAAYRFGDPSEVKNHRLKGRIVLPKSLKETLPLFLLMLSVDTINTGLPIPHFSSPIFSPK